MIAGGVVVSDEGNLVVEMAERIFADLADSQAVIQSRSDAWKAPLWRALSDSGLPMAWVAADGGSADLADGFGALRAAGRAAVALPLAETMLAGWLLAQAGIEPPNTAMTVAPAGLRDRVILGADGRLTGRARRVPFARDVESIAVLASGDRDLSIALVAVTDCMIEQGVNLAGDPADEVMFSAVHPLVVGAAPAGWNVRALLLMGSVARCQQIAGALETMLDISTRYATERIAFEKQISKYQSVQHNLARLSSEVAAAVSAACSAADALASGLDGDDVFLEVASAKIRCGEAAEKGAAIAHQVHGAIGYTSEHILHRLTLRALAWRDDFGVESYWAAELGNLIGRRGADELWPLVSSR
jgi:acyl-CoA dehydrogenase